MMKIFVLIGQRKQDYEGEYALEVLAAIDEFSDEDNPDYMKGELKKCVDGGEFDALSVVPIKVNKEEVMGIIYPKKPTIEATVIVGEK